MGSTIAQALDQGAVNELNFHMGYIKNRYTRLSKTQQKYAVFISQQYVATPIGIMSFIKFRQLWDNHKHRAFDVDTMYSWIKEHEISSLNWYRKFGDWYAVLGYDWIKDERRYRLCIDLQDGYLSDGEIVKKAILGVVSENKVPTYVDNVTDAFKTIKLMNKLFRRTKSDRSPKRTVYTLARDNFS